MRQCERTAWIRYGEAEHAHVTDTQNEGILYSDTSANEDNAFRDHIR